MKKREYPVCIVTNRASGSVRAGHPWLSESDIRSMSAEVAPGDIVDVLNPRGK